MRLQLISNDGELLDSTDLTADEFADEVAKAPHSVLALLSPGTDPDGEQPDPHAGRRARKPAR